MLPASVGPTQVFGILECRPRPGKNHETSMRFGLAALICWIGVLAACSGSLSPAADKADRVTLQRAADHLDFLIAGRLVGRYQIGASLAKPYLWPLLAPGNVAITRAWPMEPANPGGSTDHPHQKSAWFCHGDVIPEGLEIKQKIRGVKGVDFWSEAKGHGRIVCTDVGSPQKHADGIRVSTRNEWQTADGRKIMDETRVLHLHDLGQAWLFVFDIDLTASVAPIVFGDTKEGSFGVRVSDSISVAKGKGKIQNAEGKTAETNCWGRLSAWCDYSGTIDGQPAGIALFDDPQNRSPACWHVRGYGLMAANPFGRAHSFPAMEGRTDPVRLNKGEHLRLRYGLLLHRGDAGSGQVAEMYRRFLALR
jgi:hypothetical protein